MSLKSEIAVSRPPGPKPGAAWLWLGYAVILLILLGHWLYLAGGCMGLSEDEAYQWLWSKHLALSYFSKPLGIAFIQRAGTSIAGDTELGVRFFSPVFAALLSLLAVRFLAREADARTAFWILIATLATPLLLAGSVLMTVDSPFVLCWFWAVVAGWRALQPQGRTRDWLVVGLALGLGVLCKQSALYQVICWGIIFALLPAARGHLRRPGPWLALLMVLLGAVPMIVWNAQHGWITVHHVAANAGMDHKWHPTLRFFFEFMGAEFGLLNPVFFIGCAWAAIAIWRRAGEKPLWVYLFCMGPLIFAGHILYSLHSRILPNWIAPAVPPMFCLMALYWHERPRTAKPWLITGLIIGLLAATFLHDTDLVGKLIHPLPGDADLSRRIGRGYSETAALIEKERQAFDPGAFVIADRYGTTGLYTFYSPAGRAAAAGPQPLIYCQGSELPINQFYFWPEYNYWQTRRGQNAIYVRRLDPYKLEQGWIWKWLRGEPVGYRDVPPLSPAPYDIALRFGTVTNLGLREIRLADGRVFQRVEIFGCRNLK